MILIVTSRVDSHADHFIRLAARQGASVFRLNTEDLLVDYKLRIWGDSADGFHGSIEDSLGREFELGSASVGWYRKPSIDFRGAGHQEKYNDLVRAEAKAFLEVIYTWPNFRWLVNPLVASQAKSKVQQLSFAYSNGIRIPKTIITNSIEEAENFSHANKQGIISKAIYTANVDVDGRNAAIPTCKIFENEDTSPFTQVKLCPTKFQEEIKKDFEVRVTIIGDKIFSTKIDSQSDERTKIDWRPFAHLCQHSCIKIPDRIESFCFHIVNHFSLNFGAIDFIVDRDGEYVFLELNPFGQYLWIENETGQEITSEIFKYLTGFFS